ncbi:hypothetical protein ACQEU8_00500 [Streptomyces sp. CA-250714]|uniref:hypothetical protein n=1 Tax=Streptomyces sp. CA-250714 TaxID=3240060 RepID=UPI003D8C9290
MGWRFANPTDDLPALFRRIAAVAPEHLEWVFDCSRRNWLLIPARLSRQQLETSGVDFPEMRDVLRRTDQEYCRTANTDMERIVDCLEGHDLVSAMFRRLARRR